MFRRIRLKNFMSHVDTEIELSDGVNVIVGPNNCGKSAIVSALYVLATNASGNFMVRHGCDECSVTVTTDDGHEITWRRLKGVPSYILDGKEFYKVGKGNLPTEIQNILKLRSGDSTLDAFDVHFGHQKKPIFLLNEPGSKPAQFFASSSDAGRLLKMQKLHKDKVLQARNERKSLMAEQTRVNQKLTILNQTVDLGQKLSQLEALKSTYEACVQDIGALEHGIARLQSLQREVDVNRNLVELLAKLSRPPVLEDTSILEKETTRLSQLELLADKTREQTKVLAKLDKPPELADTSVLFAKLSKLKTLSHRAVYTRKLVQVTENLRQVPNLYDVAVLTDQLKRLANLKRQLSHERSIVSVTADLLAPPQSIDVTDLRVLLSRLQQLHRLLSAAEQKVKVVECLTPPPDLLPTEELEERLAGIVSTIGKVNEISREHRKLQAELRQVRKQIEYFLAVNPICPLCGSEMKLETMVGGGDTRGV